MGWGSLYLNRNANSRILKAKVQRLLCLIQPGISARIKEEEKLTDLNFYSSKRCFFCGISVVSGDVQGRNTPVVSFADLIQ